MPVVFKTTKIAQRAESDPLLYEMLRDFSLGGTQLSKAITQLEQRLNVVASSTGGGFPNCDLGQITEAVTTQVDLGGIP